MGKDPESQYIYYSTEEGFVHAVRSTQRELAEMISTMLTILHNYHHGPWDNHIDEKQKKGEGKEQLKIHVSGSSSLYPS